MPNYPTIISFYTKGTLYEKEAEDLIESCEKFNLKSDIVGIDSLGSWEKNCCYKPQFILEKLNEFKSSVLWVDIDGMFFQKPHFLLLRGFDLAIRIDPKVEDDHHSKVVTSTIYVNPTKAAEELLISWKDECQKSLKEKKDLPFGDQECFRDVLLHKEYFARILPLPLGYARVYDHPEDYLSEEETFIVQFQASRIYKKFINGEEKVSPDLQKKSGKELKKSRSSFQFLEI